MKTLATVLLLSATTLAAAPNSESIAPVPPSVAAVIVPTQQRIAEIRALLVDGPVGAGRPVGDRAAWNAEAARLPRREIVAEAERLAAQPVPPLPDALYLLFTQTGSRTEYERAFNTRMNRMRVLAWAEALEGNGRFLAALARNLEATLGERTWTLPAHDASLDAFYGRHLQVDLGSAMTAWELATVDYWLGAQLPANLRDRLRSEIRRRVLTPYLGLLHGARRTSDWWWVTTTNNWNAVCHAGVVGAALALAVPNEERAEIVAGAEANLSYYFSGFTPDGYCVEGIGYWNYGFGHAAMLADAVSRATGGRLRLIGGDKARAILAYPDHIAILPGIYPSFADGDLRATPDLFWRDLAEQAMGFAPAAAQRLARREIEGSRLYEAALKVFASGNERSAAPRSDANLRFWFADANVLVSRANSDFGAAIKGGNNGQSHGHNALGSFVVAVGNATPVLDPGGEIYTARTFSAHRYDSQVINSYGHDVPLVAGKLQSTGQAFAARVLAADFTAATDHLVLDLAGGYQVPTLTSLHRDFRLTRGPEPVLVVTDTVAFKTPEAFGTALVTLGTWHQDGPNALILGDDNGRVRVEVDATGGKLRLAAEPLPERIPGGGQVTRIGVDLDAPVTSGEITMRITPLR